MDVTYAQVARILQRALGEEEGLIVLEFFMSRIPEDVARQQDVYELRLEIEKIRAELIERIEQVRAELTKEIEQVRAELTKEIEQVRADLTKEIEQVRADLTKEIEQLRADLTRDIALSKATQTRWAFLFWISQMAVLVGILFQLLR